MKTKYQAPSCSNCRYKCVEKDNNILCTNQFAEENGEIVDSSHRCKMHRFDTESSISQLGNMEKRTGGKGRFKSAFTFN